MYALSNGKTIGDIGYGLMGLTNFVDPKPDEQAFAAMKAALAQGCNFWNGGEFYGTPDNNSLVLLNKYFTAYPEDADKVVLSIKGSFSLATFAPDCSPAAIRRSVEGCVKQLNGTKKIDYFECARVDPKVPIEESVGALVELINEGKIGGYMLSEAGAATIRRAHKVHPCSGVELEVSLWATDPLTNGAAEACAELGIPIIAYSPVGRGMLTGTIKSLDDLPENDLRKKHMPRFQPGIFEANLALINRANDLAASKGVTPAQFAISWVMNRSRLYKGLKLIPIPGSSKEARVVENAGAAKVTWTDEDEESIAQVLKECEVVGGRYPPQMEQYLSL